MTNSVYRLHVRPTLEGRLMEDASAWCIENNVAGIGWPVEPDPDPATPEAYEAMVVAKYGSRRPASIRFSRVAPGDYLWLRGPDGAFRMGCVASSWRYAAPEDEARTHGLFGLVDVQEWHTVGTAADVPGELLRTYRARSPTLERLSSDSMLSWCRAVAAGESLEYSAVEVVQGLLTPTDVEDLVALWFQARHGSFLVPPSRARDDAAIDLELVARPSGNRVVVQVKTGTIDVDEDTLPGVDAEGWVYAERGIAYDGTNRRLNADDLAAFLTEERAWIPPRFTRWLAPAEDVS